MGARAVELANAGVAFVAATVVRAQRPTSAHAGDTALVHGDGVIEGFVGGSCAESSVRLHALEALASGEPLLLRIRPGEPGTTVEEGAVTVVNPCLSGGAIEIFLEPRLPAPRVLVVGDTPVAHALQELGAILGFTMESMESMEPAESVASVAAEAVVAGGNLAALIVASHGRQEEPALEAALRAGVPYVGLVASATRGEAVVSSLDIDDALRDRVTTPAGLEIGARSAPEIALSILAQLVAERSATRSSGGAPVATPAHQHIDPVCGMSVAASPATPQLEHRGITVCFCGEGCRGAFAADPDSYAAAL
ncbi:MAG: XdhC family protein [Candidatus Dormibacteraeota bacterium]|uniref:XdhC family protein n=1 Tax=Candidatus Amunia macphersoniae TaxID=3127014 RepID=A0A934KJH5_9BACT|nr:XdhC family protein [Candidatus Dormibacteraeota bacterium]